MIGRISETLLRDVLAATPAQKPGMRVAAIHERVGYGASGSTRSALRTLAEAGKVAWTGEDTKRDYFRMEVAR